MKQKTYTFKKGKVYTIDDIAMVMAAITNYTRKPNESDAIKHKLSDAQIGDESEYEIFESTISITIKIR
jgi:hypothetical protein